MTDESDGSKNASVADTEPPNTPKNSGEPEEPKIMGLPMAMFIRGGGTPTMAHTAQMEEWRQGDEARRVEADQERAIASKPIEEGGGVLYTNRLTDSPEAETAKVLLEYMMPAGREVARVCLADITIHESGELELIMVCPKCIENGVPHGRAQLNIKQSNKPWELDLRKLGEPIFFDGNVYRSAGRVRACPLSKCPDCKWAFTIDDNRVYPQ